jgi:hypothetical protein
MTSTLKQTREFLQQQKVAALNDKTRSKAEKHDVIKIIDEVYDSTIAVERNVREEWERCLQHIKRTNKSPKQ